MDLIFKALSDDTRRLLLDRLRQRDGQTLTDLEASTGMTRFGVMKHLKLLEAANLVITHKAGRFKYHYLNAAPLQQLVDRWIEPMTQQPLARAALDLKAELERTIPMSDVKKPDFMLETFIRATPDRVWQALTTTELSKQFMLMGGGIYGTIATNETYEYRLDDGKVMVSGKILAAEAPSLLDMTFMMPWMGPDAPISRNVYKLAAVGDLTKLTILHYDLPAEQEGLKEAWAQIAASLKSLMETGKGLHFEIEDHSQTEPA